MCPPTKNNQKGLVATFPHCGLPLIYDGCSQAQLAMRRKLGVGIPLQVKEHWDLGWEKHSKIDGKWMGIWWCFLLVGTLGRSVHSLQPPGVIQKNDGDVVVDFCVFPIRCFLCLCWMVSVCMSLFRCCL